MGFLHGRSGPGAERAATSSPLGTRRSSRRDESQHELRLKGSRNEKPAIQVLGDGGFWGFLYLRASYLARRELVPLAGAVVAGKRADNPRPTDTAMFNSLISISMYLPVALVNCRPPEMF